MLTDKSEISFYRYGKNYDDLNEPKKLVWNIVYEDWSARKVVVLNIFEHCSFFNDLINIKKELKKQFGKENEEIQSSKEVILLAQDTARPVEIKNMLEELKEKVTAEIVGYGYAPITPCIGAHTGAGLLGLGAITIDNLKEKEALKLKLIKE